MRRRIAKGRPVVGPTVPRDLRNFARDTLKMKWPDYVESFGIPYPLTRQTRGWARKDVLDRIRERQAQGQRINVGAVLRDCSRLCRQAMDYLQSEDAPVL